MKLEALKAEIVRVQVEQILDRTSWRSSKNTKRLDKGGGGEKKM